mmetsp:Transcript_8037/g.10853  ORF Transcript_8037/g.10853 Transcript_8037/m.10853 type:complete len:695 (+) Transcript_8037:365-2449(+)|eukprot:CAMPEP_0196572974 /NCGR_PEP_ID=MMETSP1081-20130531/2917_1 /TAXON_ID=36882 /ORGANISM="Pyramimonas amylifera, Strain CCMP720" /LENGTH=694 /DNA_ID=CAMNT_0041890501 /DNA_START=348 /DNA_END=2432 /DNA_ORIENTATION=-
MATAAAAPSSGPAPPPPPPGPPTPAVVPGTTGTSAVSASLYVGDLEREVTEAQLYDLFSQVGPVASIRVCRDAVTRRSLGYAYVNYNSGLDEHAADRALETLNYTQINGKPIRIMWSHRDPSARKSGVGNIFIKNLEETIDNKALHDTFTAFGTILSCKVATELGKSKGYGFVHFETEEAAVKAVDTMNGVLVNGKKVYVGPFMKKGERPSDDNEPKFTNVFVKNFPEDVTEEALKTKFEEYGTITNVVIMRDEAGKSKGFGFVNFESATEAAAAVSAVHGVAWETAVGEGTPVPGRVLYCGRAQKKSEREALLRNQYQQRRMERIEKYQNVNLYVKNLDDSVDDDKLREEFSAFGTITSAKVQRAESKDDKSGSKGFGFVCFTSPEEATKAVTEMNGKMLNGKPVYVALAQRKEVRRVQLEQHYAQRMLMPPPASSQGGGLLPPGAQPGQAGMYPPGTPVFYAPGPQGGHPGGRGPQPGVMYQSLVPRGYRGPMGPGGPGARPGAYPPMQPNYAVPPNQGGRQGGRQNRQQRQVGGPVQGGQMGPKGPQGAQGPGGPGAQQRGGRGGGRVGPGAAGAGGRGGGGPQPPVPAPAAAAGVVPGAAPEASPLTTATLAAAPPDQQKQMLGERLFPLVHRLQPEMAGKITGMLLEMDNTELLNLLESPESLSSKVDEAITVLRQHGVLSGSEGTTEA